MMDNKHFYDEYVDHQVAVGVNERHRAIMRWLRRFGLKPHHSVLEIGCGIGTLTELLASELTAGGSVLAVDFSPRSVETARRRLASAKNVKLMVADAVETDLEGDFDVVVLPDVIEHIPLESHDALFSRLGSWVKPHGFVFLHYPNPNYLEWCQEHKPEALQAIDQPIHADVLLSHAYRHGFYLQHLEQYGIWILEGDYVAAALRPTAGLGSFTVGMAIERTSLVNRLAARLRSLTA